MKCCKQPSGAGHASCAPRPARCARIMALVLCLILITGILPAHAAGSMGNFVSTRSYDGRFSDVAEGAWYYENVVSLYELGLANGQSGSAFGPQSSVTLGEAAAFTARLRSLYETGDPESGASSYPLEDGDPWYAGYVDYLSALGVVDSSFAASYDAPATRAQVAHLIANALPAAEFTDRNAAAVAMGYALHAYITDVDEYTPYQQEILQLYRWGVVTGSDSQGSYYPDRAITRGELTALLTRLADPALRVALEWDLSSYYSARGTTYQDLVEPGTLRRSHSLSDTSAIDSNIRYMLSRGESVLTLQLEAKDVTEAKVTELMNQYLTTMRRYLEQSYNAVNCTYSASTGRVTLRFYSSIFSDALLPSARSTTLDRAIAVHDALWQDGTITADMSEYEKARAYFTWICENCAYDHRATDNSVAHTAYSLFEMGSAVCDGYTAAYNLLLKLEGIDCTTQSTEDHIWTVATLDGTTYHIDTTWGDQTGSIRYQYFAMTPEVSMARFS